MIKNYGESKATGYDDGEIYCNFVEILKDNLDKIACKKYWVFVIVYMYQSWKMFSYIFMCCIYILSFIFLITFFNFLSMQSVMIYYTYIFYIYYIHILYYIYLKYSLFFYLFIYIRIYFYMNVYSKVFFIFRYIICKYIYKKDSMVYFKRLFSSFPKNLSIYCWS